MYRILDKIDAIDQLKKLNLKELNILAQDIRKALLNKISKSGGHLGSNLAMIETSIALHYVFDSPKDKFIFDVSHQTYTHKILTGRKKYYLEDKLFSTLSGFSSPLESEHDHFTMGHTSTSISLAIGMAKARELRKSSEKIIAIIGDGALSGGQALESLSIAASDINSNLIIIVNDNEMSISENHGGIYKSLEDLRKSKGKSTNNIFKTFGLDYRYEENGNDIESMINILKEVKEINKPVVLHIHTKKGKGYKFAEEKMEDWHSTLGFDIESGKNSSTKNELKSYKDISKDFIMKKAKEDKDFLVLTPAMPRSFDLDLEDRKLLKDQYIDTGIAEASCISMAAGLAKNGAKPLVITNATFMQRAYDQVSQDLSMDNNPATILLIKSNFDAARDKTHLGIFTLSIFSNIPNLVLLAPSSKSEYINMLEWSINQRKHPVMILCPGNEVTDRDSDRDFSQINTFKLEEKGKKVAILALGDFYQKGVSLSKKISESLNFKPSLVNPRFASGLDKELLEDLKKDHQLVITLEDGILDGGFGQKVASFYSDSDIKVKSYALDKLFYDRFDPKKLLDELGIVEEKILEDIKKII